MVKMAWVDAELILPEYLGAVFVLLLHYVQELNVANAKKFILVKKYDS